MKTSTLVAVLVSAGALLWIASGVFTGKEESPPEAAGLETHAPLPVRVRTLSPELFSSDVVLTGRTKASRTVEMKAETEGSVEALHVIEGDFVSEGQLLATLEIRDREARVRESEQLVKQREIEFNAAESLENRGFNSKVKLAQARADLEAARARLKAAQTDLEKTQIKAPFDGVVARQDVEKGDFVSIGGGLFEVVDLDPVELSGFVSERRISEIRKGTPAKAGFLDGRTLEGVVSYVSPAADPETRTFRIEISASNPDMGIVDGLTAEIRVHVEQKQAYRISPSILTLDDIGRVGVRIVLAGDHRVQFVPVNILSDMSDHMMVEGIPEGSQLITVGQDFVSDGQIVRPVESDGDGLL